MLVGKLFFDKHLKIKTLLGHQPILFNALCGLPFVVFLHVSEPDSRGRKEKCFAGKCYEVSANVIDNIFSVCIIFCNFNGTKYN